MFGRIREPIIDEMREKMYDLLPESVLHDRADSGYGKNLRDVQRAVPCLRPEQCFELPVYSIRMGKQLLAELDKKEQEE